MNTTFAQKANQTSTPTKTTNNSMSNNNSKIANNNTNKNNRNSNYLSINIEVESLENSRWWRACIAGSMAGLTEHSLLYPIDTIKTRMQAFLLHKHANESKSFFGTFSDIVKHERPRVLFRGLPAVLTAAIPSHAAYFAAYEYAKYKLISHPSHPDTYHPLSFAIAGICATMAHDFIVTPFDVIKQRMQIRQCRYANVCKCAIETFKKEGFQAFVRSYPTTVLLNIPVFSTNFVVYESSKIFLRDTILEDEEYWMHHLIAGGIAGGCAGLISNPLDVIKTAMQTDSSVGTKKSISTFVKKILTHNPSQGYSSFFKGASARILYSIPSSAIVWITYEGIKNFLGFPVDDLEKI